jgi:macrolide-specific efflux system membrane fusion protein
MATIKINPVPTLVPPVSNANPVPNKVPHAASFWQRRRFWLIGAVLAVVAAALGYRWAFAAPKVVYTTAPVQRGDIESTVVAAGIVQPVKYVDVGAQTSGMLKSLKVQRGDHVEKGQLLAEIDPALADTALTSSNAALSSMTSQRAVKQAALVLAKAQMVRSDALFAAGVISASERDVTRAANDAASADVASLSAQMRQAGAAVATGKTNVGYTKITAPMAGEVVSITLLEGQTLNANQSAPNILRIADISTVTVWSQVSEADIVDVKPGQLVYFTVLGSTRRWSGTVRQVLPTPELINNVVFYDVLFDIPNPGGELKIQMTAQVFIVLAQAKGVLLVPAAAIGNASEGSTIKVQVLKPDGTVETRTVKIGIKSELAAEVTSGLNEKEQVVIGGKTATTATAKKTSALSSQKGR